MYTHLVTKRKKIESVTIIKKIISGLKMIWFPPGRAIAQMSTESGPGGEGGRVLKGGGGMPPRSWGPNSPTPSPPALYETPLFSLESAVYTSMQGRAPGGGRRPGGPLVQAQRCPGSHRDLVGGAPHPRHLLDAAPRGAAERRLAGAGAG